MFVKLLSAWLVASIWVAGSLAAAPVTVTEMDGAMQPQVAVSSAGVVHVAFGQKDTGIIYHVSSSDRGVSYGKPVQVGVLPKLALGMRRGPRISVSGKLLVVTAISHADGTLYGWSSVDAGASWSQPQAINDAPKTAGEGLHAMASDARSNVFIVWLDSRNKGMQLWGAASSDAGLHWGKNLLIYESPDGTICPCCHPSIAMDGVGQIAVMWRNSIAGARDMFLSVSKDNGKSFAPASKLGTGTWTLDACPMDGGTLAFDSKGEILTIWRRNTSIYLTSATEAEKLVAEDGRHPIIASGKGGAFLVWEANGGLMASSAATPAPAVLANMATFAAAAPIAGGGSVVVWESRAGDKPTLAGTVVE